jgi:hypothetical protein
VLALTITDCLSFLRIDDGSLDEWLGLTAGLISKIPDPMMRDICVDRFWDVLSNGEMDVERANYCVMWWSTRGGRELLLAGEQKGEDDGAYMSGALIERDDRVSKL